MKFFAALTIFSGVSSAAVIYPPYPYQPANLTVKRTTVNNVKRASAKDATLGSLLQAASKGADMVSQQVPEMKEQGGQLSQAINQFEKAISNITVPDSMTAN